MRGHFTRGNVVKAAAIALALAAVYWGIQANTPGVGPVLADGHRMDPCAMVQRGTVGVPKAIRDGERRMACAKGAAQVAPGLAPRASTAGFDAAAARPIARSGRRIPFHAAHAGTLPASGRPTVAGVTLPAGKRHARYWVADAETPDAIRVASRLARAFPKTGLWPVLWDWADEGPDGYANADATPHDADGVDVLGALNHAWAAFHQTRLGALAPSSTLPAQIPDPFAQLATARDAVQSPKGQRLVVVAVRRPADAIAMTGFAWTEVVSPAEQTAVARSWEERFGATLTVMSPGGVGLSVAAPPTGDDQAGKLALEQDAFGPEDGDHDDPAALADALRTGGMRGFWSFGWPD